MSGEVGQDQSVIRTPTAQKILGCFVCVWFLLPGLQKEIRGADTEGRYSIRAWQTEDGLPQNSILSITQTPDGFLWLGTASGLTRFDGMEFTTFTTANSPGLVNDRVFALTVDKAGTLWAGTERGITQLKEGKFKSYTRSDGMTNDLITSLCVDGEGAVWGAGLTGADRIKDGHVTVFQPSGATEWVRDVGSDRSGHMWALMDKGGLYLYENGRFERHDIEGYERKVPQGFYQDSRGDYWTGMLFTGLARWNTNGVTFYSKDKEVPQADVFAHGIVEDSSGTLWFAFPPFGLMRYANGKLERFTTEEGLPSVQLRSIFMDREDNLWIGTADTGLLRLRPKIIQNLTQRQGLRQFLVRALCNDGEGGFWIANAHDGLYRFQEGQFTKIPGTGGESLWTLLRTSRGELLGGKYPHGFLRLPTDDWGEKRIGSPDGHIQALLEDRNGTVWLGGEYGVSRYENGKIIPITDLPEVKGFNFSSLIEDRDGSIWAGAQYDGIFRIQNGKVTRFGKDKGLRSESVHSLLKDDDGTVWAGTTRGLSRFENGTFKTLGAAEGLTDEIVNQLLDDGLGNLWIGGNNGIYRLKKADIEACLSGSTRTVFPLSFGKHEGLLSLECRHGSQPSCLRGQDGKLYFVTFKSIAIIDPKNIPTNSAAPPVVIERVSVDGADVLSAFSRPSPASLVIPAGALRAEYHFAGLNLSAPERIHYRYRLEGYDDDWVESGTRRFALYTRVPPGSYRFRVRAANGDGVWNETGATLAVTVQPYFWQTIWFEGLVCLTLLASAYAIYGQRIRQLERKRLEQQAFSLKLIASQEQERKRLASEIHDGLGQNLLIIKNRATMAQTGIGTASIAEQLDEISRSALEAIQEVRTIAHNLRPYQLDRLGLTKALQAMAKQFSSPELTLTAEIAAVDKVLPAEHEISFYRIIQESLNNISKHAGAKNAWLTVEKENSRVIVTIRDDGCGFDYEALMNNPLGKRGLGLTGLMERARSMGAELRIESAPGRGTRAVLVVPIEQKT